jgi:riboflavin synthase
LFTGIIEEIGNLKDIKRGANNYELTISGHKILEDVKLGDSIAVNGVCLTVTSFSKEQFTVDVMPETIKATSLQSLGRGSRVNLERAMSFNGRFGGHFVSGHVDGVGTINDKKVVSNAVYFWIEASDEQLKYIIPKGSVCIDGISLTVVEVTESQFSISIIPHTVSETILQYKGIGDVVNIECDMLAKYMERLLNPSSHNPQQGKSRKKGLSLHMLEENGYL